MEVPDATLVTGEGPLGTCGWYRDTRGRRKCSSVHRVSKKSQRAFSTIALAISTPQLYLVTSCEQLKEAWDALRTHFERETLANKLFLKKQYFRTEMKEGTLIEAHL